MLNAKNFGLACGLTWALCAAFLALAAQHLNWGVEVVELLATVYRGYDATLIGAVIGAAWALIDGFIGGFVLAWIYGKLQK